jgi:predicted dehydrogenase
MRGFLIMDESTSRPLSRRRFISHAAVGAAGVLAMPARSWGRVLGANERIRLGVIGTGSRGVGVMRLFHAQQDVQVVALNDIFDVHLQQAREVVGSDARTYRDYRELLAAQDVDAVLIATPDHWHAPMAIDAARAGKDIYIEKPLTHELEEGYAIAKAVREADRVMQVGLQQRSGAHYRRAKEEYFDSGVIGKVTFVRTVWHGNTFHLRQPSFTAQPAGLDWEAWLGPAASRPFDAHQFYNWRSYFDFGGGTITDLFNHWIDVAHWFMNDDVPVAGVASGGIFHYPDGRTAPDTVNVLVDYPDRWTASFEATLVPGARGAFLEFNGTGGSLVITRSQYTFTPPGQGAQPVVVTAEGDLTEAHVRDFIESVRSRRAPSSDVVSGHRSALACHIGKHAYLRKERVTFDPEAERQRLS